MEKVLIITDCTDNKRIALKGVCIEHFGLHDFDIHYIEHVDSEDTPLSFEALSEAATKKLQHLEKVAGSEKDFIIQETYFATLQKGFLHTVQNRWMLAAYAVLGKQGNIIPGISEIAALKPEVNSFMHLPKEKRYDKFAELYPTFTKTPLITTLIGVNEIDWYKQAFRNCIKASK